MGANKHQPGCCCVEGPPTCTLCITVIGCDDTLINGVEILVQDINDDSTVISGTTGDGGFADGQICVQFTGTHTVRFLLSGDAMIGYDPIFAVSGDVTPSGDNFALDCETAGELDVTITLTADGACITCEDCTALALPSTLTLSIMGATITLTYMAGPDGNLAWWGCHSFPVEPATNKNACGTAILSGTWAVYFAFNHPSVGCGLIAIWGCCLNGPTSLSTTATCADIAGRLDGTGTHYLLTVGLFSNDSVTCDPFVLEGSFTTITDYVDGFGSDSCGAQPPGGILHVGDSYTLSA